MCSIFPGSTASCTSRFLGGLGEIEDDRIAAEGEDVRVIESINSAGDRHDRGPRSFVGLDTQPLK